jgi:interferon-induced GTP-binding protein Mx
VNVLIDCYMQQPHTIILAVVPSNQDVATVEVLERAARFDPHGDRTIGVLTKPDLIDQGAEHEVVSVLRNLTKPLQLGYIMVKNRSQHDMARGNTYF